MDIEYEATFPNIDKEAVRGALARAGAVCVKKEFLQKRVVFRMPVGHEIAGGWLRVRDEGDKITMSLKVVDGDKIENQKEICVTVDSFENACALLEMSGCARKAYQETLRELWVVRGVEVTIDEWPFLEPLVEVEGNGEEVVKEVAELLGFDWSQARFCSAGTLYAEKYGITEDEVNNGTPELLFAINNPFK